MYKTTGFISFLFRRLSGVALALYLFVHMLVIGSVNSGAANFDEAMTFLTQPLFKLFEIALLAAFAYHSLDGIRLMVVSYGNVTNQRKAMFYALLIVAFLVVLVGAVPILIEIVKV
ncbi:succinate dehydrogenase, cytochrome b556 subunit [Chloroflexota bacterium]